MARIWQTGFEQMRNNNVAAEGLTYDTAGFFPTAVAGELHRDYANTGGSRALFANPGYRNFTPTAGFSTTLNEGFIRLYALFPLAGTNYGLRIRPLLSSTVQCEFEMTADGSVVFRSGTGVTLASGTWIPIYGRYFRVDVQFLIEPSGGYAAIFADALPDYSNPLLTFSGDTTVSGTPQFSNFTFGLDMTYLDDVAVNSRSLWLKGASGSFLPGDTLTSGGATAVFTSSLGERYTIHGWNLVPFVDGAVITSSSGGTATVYAPSAAFVNGLEPNSGMCELGYQVALPPTAAGATTQLSNSAGSAGSNNWRFVDEFTVNTSDYVLSSTTGQYDTYTAANLPATAATVKSVRIVNYASRNGVGITNYADVLRVGGVDFFSGANNLTVTTYRASPTTVWNTSPVTEDAFTVVEVNGAEPGFQVLT